MKVQPNSLQQYQQSLQQPLAQAPQRQQEATQQVEPQNRTLLQRMGDAARESIAQGFENAKQYGKEVVTGQKLWEGLKQNDGALDGWIAHGSTELANMLLHGHPAPVYARTLSPAHQQAEVQQDAPGEAVAPEANVPVEQQAAVDVQLSSEMSLEMYQRGMQAEQHQQRQQEIER